MMEELWASVLIPLMTEDGDPPEDTIEYPVEKTEEESEEEW